MLSGLRFIGGALLALVLLIYSCNPIRKTVSAPVTDTSKKNPLRIPDIIMPDGTKNDMLMEKILNQNPAAFAEILQNRKEWNVQVIYTEVNRGNNNQPQLKNYYFNVNPNKYFYPASTVKLPVLLLALEKLNSLRVPGLTKSSTMLTGAGYGSQTEVYNDPTSFDGRPTIAQYIKKILLTSDNDAFNRLYEFIGQESINESLRRKGYSTAEIRHRVGIVLSEEENRHTNPIKFLDETNSVIYDQPAQENKNPFSSRKDSLGIAYMANEKLVNQPMNFSKKNRISLEDLHLVLRSVIFPNSVNPKQRFNIKSEDYKFVWQYMSQFPRETLYPAYDPKEFPDHYCKYLVPVYNKDSLPKHIRIFNKPGNAYGQMLDVAYIVDLDKKIEFFLSAVIYANKDGVLNDDKYDYETIALPFFKNLAKVFYEYELKRERKKEPDLEQFRILYDK